MNTETFIFIRRTPRALNFHTSSSRPMNVRKAGTTQRSIQWKQADDTPISRGVVNAIRNRTDRRTLEVDLANVAGAVTFDGYVLEHMPESPMFRECIKITKRQ